MTDQPAATLDHQQSVTGIPFDELDGFEHHMIDAGGLRLHVVEGGDREAPAVVLLAGFPQTWYAWHKVMPGLAASHHVVAIDLPGQGHSDRPATGYDTATVAEHVRAVVDRLKLGTYWLVAHDAGAWVAVPYALSATNGLAGLVLLDAGIPGVSLPETVPTDPARAAKLAHFAFHVVPELPEMLIAGKERDYVGWFLTHKTAAPGVFSQEDIDRYARLFAAADGVRAVLAYYRSSLESARRNRELAARRRIQVPVLAISADQGSVPDMAAAVRPIADDVTSARITDSGHFVPEEQPDQVLRAVSAFMR